MTEKTIGIIAVPEFSTEVANQLKEELPSILKNKNSEDIFWQIEITTDGITSVAENYDVLLNSVLNKQEHQNWDFTLCLTDVPSFFENETSLARVHLDHDTAFLSLPALGWFVRKRVTHTAVHLIEDLYYKNSSSSNKEDFNQIFRIHNIQTVTKDKIIRYLFSSKLSGRLTILIGMTYDNQPWTIMPSLKSVIAIAFGSGAYGMIFPTLWQLSYAYSPWRLVTLTLLAILSLTVWIIQGHNLWESDSMSNNPEYKILYNATTSLTLFIAISFFYVILVFLFLGTAFVLVDPTYYAQSLGISGTPHLLHYLQLALMTASVGTITGAVGVGLEEDENDEDNTE